MRETFIKADILHMDDELMFFFTTWSYCFLFKGLN